jgi:hypothetical protein
MRFSDSADLQAAGTAALTAVCSLNRANTLAALRELVHRLLQHEPKVRGRPNKHAVGGGLDGCRGSQRPGVMLPVDVICAATRVLCLLVGFSNAAGSVHMELVLPRNMLRLARAAASHACYYILLTSCLTSALQLQLAGTAGPGGHARRAFHMRSLG